MTLVVMAAGMGSRFGGLKQIEPINKDGEFIIDYSIYDAIKAGFTKVVFVIKEENYQIFKETIGKRIEKHIKVEYAFQSLDDLPKGYTKPSERLKPWGTAHAVLCAKKNVNEPFVIINSDDFYGYESFKVISQYLKNTPKKNNLLLAASVIYKLGNTLSINGSVKRGVCEEKNNKLTNLIESEIIKENNKLIAHPLENNPPFEVSENTPVAVNFFAFTPKIFEYLEQGFKQFLDKNIKNLTSEYLLPNYIFELINKKILEVDVLKTNSKWLGVTYKEDKEYVINEIKKLHQTKKYPEHLWKKN